MLSQIKRFESLNDIFINVYIIEKQKEILPLQFTDRKRGKHVNHLYVQVHATIIQGIDQGFILPCEIANYSNEELFLW